MSCPLTALEPDSVKVTCEQAAVITRVLDAEDDLCVYASYTEINRDCGGRDIAVTDWGRDSDPGDATPYLGTYLERGDDGADCRHWATPEGLELLAPRGGAT